MSFFPRRLPLKNTLATSSPGTPMHTHLRRAMIPECYYKFQRCLATGWRITIGAVRGGDLTLFMGVSVCVYVRVCACISVCACQRGNWCLSEYCVCVCISASVMTDMSVCMDMSLVSCFPYSFQAIYSELGLSGDKNKMDHQVSAL